MEDYRKFQAEVKGRVEGNSAFGVPAGNCPKEAKRSKKQKFVSSDDLLKALKKRKKK